MAVGSTGATGSVQFVIDKWDGSSWSKPTYTAPSGAVESRLNGVSCRSTASCMAVGSYVDSGKATHPLALMWDGSSWTQLESPSQPGGSTGAELLAVACPAESQVCGAAGSYTDAGGKKHGFAPRWSGSAWSEPALPMPEGATAGEFTATSCTAATSCHLAGSYVDSAGAVKPLDLKLNSEAWTLKATPLPAEAASGRLLGISCVSSSCVGVGSYVDSANATKTFGLKYGSEEWSLSGPPVPSEAVSSQLTSVSCSAPTECTAVGSFERNSETLPIRMGWNGSAWSEQAIASESFASLTQPLSAVSCPSSTMCQAVGSLTARQIPCGVRWREKRCRRQRPRSDRIRLQIQLWPRAD